MLEFLKQLFRPNPTGSDRRRGLRVEAPQDTAVITLDGASYPIRNWSAHGFLAGAYSGPRAVGDKCRVGIDIRQDPFAIVFSVDVVIVRREGTDLAGRFMSLSPEGKAQVDAYFAFHARML